MDDENDVDEPVRTSASADKPWQAKLDDLLDPATNLADRQILLSELLTSNDQIRDDVLDALTNRKVGVWKKKERTRIFRWTETEFGFGLYSYSTTSNIANFFFFVFEIIGFLLFRNESSIGNKT